MAAKQIIVLIALVLCSFVNFSDQCARTSPGTTPVTTTAAPTGCNACTASQLQILSNQDGTKAFTSDTTTTANGCLQRVLVCDSTDPAAEASISVNDQVNGEIPAIGTTSATLVCSANGQWVLSTDTSLVVTALECTAAG